MKKGDYSQNYVNLKILSYYVVNYDVPGALPPTPRTQNTQRASPRLVSPGRNGNRKQKAVEFLLPLLFNTDTIQLKASP